MIILHRVQTHSPENLWTYKDQSAWGNVPGWEVASTGKRQSPINIDTADVVINGDLTPLKMEVS